MRAILGIIFLAHSIIAFCQERLSDYAGPGSARQNYLKVIDDKKYLIQFTQDDFLETYKLESASNKSLILKKKIPHIYLRKSKVICNGFIFYEDKKEIIGIDLLNGQKISIFQIPDDVTWVSLTSIQDKILRIFENNFPNDSRFYLYDFTNPLTEISSLYSYVSEDYLVHSYGNKMYIYDVQAHQEKVYDICADSDTWFRHKESIYFFGCNGKVGEFNFETLEFKTYPIKADSGGSRKLYVNDSLLIVGKKETDEFDIQYTQDYVKIYDISTFRLLRSYEGIYYNWNDYQEIISGTEIKNISITNSQVLIYGWHLTILDIESHHHSIHPTSYQWNGYNTMIDEHTLLICAYDDGQNYFEEINLKTRESKQYQYPINIDEHSTYKNHFSYGDTVLVVIKSLYRDDQEIICLNRNNHTAIIPDALDASYSGIEPRSAIYGIGGSIVIYNQENLFAYQDGVYNKLNPDEDTIVPFHISSLYVHNESHILFQTLSSKIFLYDGTELKVIFDKKDYPGIHVGQYYRKFKHFVLRNEYLFVQGGDDNLHIINTSNQSYRTIKNVNGVETAGGLVIYNTTTGIYASDGTEDYYLKEPSKIFEGYYIWQPRYRDKNFLFTYDGVWEINKNDNNVSLNEIFTCQSCTFYFQSNDTGDEALFSYNNSYYFFDGQVSHIEDCDEFLYGAPRIYHIGQSNYYTFERYRSADRDEKRMFDRKSTSFINVGASINGLSFENGILKTKNKEYYFSLELKREENLFTISSSSDDINAYYKVGHMNTAVFGKIKSNTIGDISLIEFGDRIFTLDESDNVNIIDGIYGIGYSPHNSLTSGNNIVNIDNKFYFLARHPESGVQLYRYNSFPDETEVNESNSSDLVIFPNPSKEYIIPKLSNGLLLSGGRFSIYSIDGKLIRKSNFSNKINVDDLLPGVYILEIQLGKKLCRELFIKQ